MDKNTFALTPPMGWNSYDYYDTMVTEDEVRANAEYIANNLKDAGWEYVVVDIEWYSYGAGSKRERYQYIPFGKVEIDEFSRLYPCVERFPSSADGKGFRPLADYIHSLGLKFGIHIMRGIPRIAAHSHSSIKGSNVTADVIADPSNICFWNPDMYGLRTDLSESQLYYDSLFELYAEWGVDFVKCDDICRMDMPSAKEEIIMLHKAIEKCGRPIVLSLSPGPAKIEEAWHYEKYSNMWRITDDFWDKWELLYNMFERCEHWQNHVSEGCYPDCDMLPVGMLGKGHNHFRTTGFTREEQKTMMTLWCIFRSPMMLGCDCTQLDEWTCQLITNKKVLHMLKIKNQAVQVERDRKHAIWMNYDPETGNYYVAVFNLLNEKQEIIVDLKDICINQESSIWNGIELWTEEKADIKTDRLMSELLPHEAAVYCITC